MDHEVPRSGIQDQVLGRCIQEEHPHSRNLSSIQDPRLQGMPQDPQDLRRIPRLHRLVHQIHQGRSRGRVRGGLRAGQEHLPVLQVKTQRRAPDDSGLLQDVPPGPVHPRPRAPDGRRPRHGQPVRGARRVLPQKTESSLRQHGLGGLSRISHIVLYKVVSGFVRFLTLYSRSNES